MLKDFHHHQSLKHILRESLCSVRKISDNAVNILKDFHHHQLLKHILRESLCSVRKISDQWRNVKGLA